MKPLGKLVKFGKITDIFYKPSSPADRSTSR